MASSEAIAVKEVLGIQPAEDGKQVLVGLATSTDEEIALSLGQDEVVDVLSDLFEATSIVPFAKGQATQPQHAIEVDAFEIGKVQGSAELTLTLLREKAHVTFKLPAGMGEKVLQALTAALGKTPPAADAAKPG